MTSESTMEVIELPGPKLSRGAKIVLGLALVTVLVYANSLGASFIFDDWQFAASDGGIRQHWNDPGLPNRVLGTWTLRMNYELGGQYPWGYRIVNIAIHVLAGIALFAVVRRTLQLPGISQRLADRADWIAGAAALVWLVHPLQAQAVTYIVQRYESLMALGFLVSLYCLIRGATYSDAKSHRREGTADDAECADRMAADGGKGKRSLMDGSLLWYAAAWVAFTLGAASKEVIAVGPLVLLLYDRAFLTGDWRESLRRRWGLYLTLLVPVAWILWASRASFAAEAEVAAGFGVDSVTPWEYLRSQPAVLLHYLRLTIWPDRLILDYGWPIARNPWEIYGLGAVILLLLGASLWATWRHPKLGFLGMAFFLVLAPTSSFMPIQDLAFEHRMYLPLAAVVVLAVLTIERILALVPRRSSQGVLATAIVLVVAAGLGVRTIQRNLDYHEPIKIWEQCIANNPRHARPYLILATLHQGEGRELAEKYYKQAVRYAPRGYKLWIDFGNFYMLGGELDRAVEKYHRAAEINPRDNVALLNIGRAELRAGRFAESLAASRQALARKPGDPQAIKQVAWILATADDDRVRNGPEAVSLLESLPQDPGKKVDAIYYEALAAAYAEAGQFDRAVAAAKTALHEARRQGARRVSEFEARVRLYQSGQPHRQRKVDSSVARSGS
jgi:tetratricopeptide (TPR) repeat protein